MRQCPNLRHVGVLKLPSGEQPVPVPCRHRATHTRQRSHKHAGTDGRCSSKVFPTRGRRAAVKCEKASHETAAPTPPGWAKPKPGGKYSHNSAARANASGRTKKGDGGSGEVRQRLCMAQAGVLGDGRQRENTSTLTIRREWARRKGTVYTPTPHAKALSTWYRLHRLQLRPTTTAPPTPSTQG